MALPKLRVTMKSGQVLTLDADRDNEIGFHQLFEVPTVPVQFRVKIGSVTTLYELKDVQSVEWVPGF